MSGDETNPYLPPLSSTPDADHRDPGAANWQPEVAEVWKRGLGFVIDAVIGFWYILPIVYSAVSRQRSLTGEITFIDTLWFSMLNLGGFVLTHGYTLQTRGQTLAKVLLRIRIVSVQDGKLLPLWRLVLFRYSPVHLLAPFPILWYGYEALNWLCLLRADRRCVHDLIAGTVVVRVERRDPVGVRRSV